MDSLENIAPFAKNRSLAHEYVLPHKIAILSLLRAFCTVKERSHCPTEVCQEEWTHTNKQQRHFAIVLLKLIQGPSIDLKDLNNLIKPILLPKTYRLFLDRLKELKDGGVAMLMDFIQGLEALMIDPLYPVPMVHKSSVTGLYLRKIMLAFDKLSFSQVTYLYRQFKNYYDASGVENGICCDEETKTDSFRKQNLLIERYWKKSQSQGTSRKQAELFIGQQAALLQTNEVESLPPKELQDKIIQLLKIKPDLAEAQYLSFLNALRVQEVLGATHSLYHCFDRSILQSPQDNKNVNGTNTNSNNSRSARYAALNLAALHAHFDHKEEALCALKEAIRIAHEANDNVCLQHALMWLTRLDPENKETLLERSILKTGEIGLPFLGALGLQSLAQSKSLLSSEPTQIFDGMIRSDILICQHSMIDLMANSYCQKSALWKTYGKTLMSSLTTQLLLNLNTSDPISSGTYHMDEGMCKALTTIAYEFFNNAQYENCDAILNFAKSLFPDNSKHSSIWIACKYTTSYIRAAWSAKWDVAHQCVKSLRVVDPVESQFRSAELSFFMGQIVDCANKLDEILKKSDTYSHYMLARVLLLKVELLCHSKSTSLAMNLLIECLTLCQNKYLDNLEALTKLYIANIKFQVNLPGQASEILQQAFHYILANSSLYEHGILYYLSAKCFLLSGKNSKAGSRKQGYLRTIEYMEKAASIFGKIEANVRLKDCKYWLALVYNEIGHKKERNQCCHNFKLLDSQNLHRTGILTGLL